MKYTVTYALDFEFECEPPELPIVVEGAGVDEIRDALGDVITHYLTEQSNGVWVDTSNQSLNDLCKEEDIKTAMKESLEEEYSHKASDSEDRDEPFLLSVHWLDEAVGCIESWSLDDSLTANGEECTIEESY